MPLELGVLGVQPVEQAFSIVRASCRGVLRPATPDPATACRRIGDFGAEVKRAAGIPATNARVWTEAADAVEVQLRCG